MTRHSSRLSLPSAKSRVRGGLLSVAFTENFKLQQRLKPSGSRHWGELSLILRCSCQVSGSPSSWRTILFESMASVIQPNRMARSVARVGMSHRTKRSISTCICSWYPGDAGFLCARSLYDSPTHSRSSVTPSRSGSQLTQSSLLVRRMVTTRLFVHRVIRHLPLGGNWY
jgi:hypothetical protein